MKLFTPTEKANQVKVLTEIRNGNLHFCKSYFEIPANEEHHSVATIEPYERNCIIGAISKVLTGNAFKNETAMIMVGHTFGGLDGGVSNIIKFNNREAKDLNDVADYLVREHGWQDIK